MGGIGNAETRGARRGGRGGRDNAGSAGIGVLPVYMARHESTLVRILPETVRLVRSYWLITHADTRSFARVRLMSDYLDQQLSEVGKDFWLD